MNRFLKFCVVGAAGFLVDTAVYYLAAIVFPVLLSRILSFSSAVFFTYYFNRSFTFEKRTAMSIAEFLKYYSAMVLGGAVNVGSFWVLMQLSSVVRSYPILGIAFGSVAGLSVNFVTSKMLLCNKK